MAAAVSNIQGSDLYGSAWGNAAQQTPVTQLASGSTTISPFIPTFWIGALIVLVAIRVIYELAE